MEINTTLFDYDLRDLTEASKQNIGLLQRLFYDYQEKCFKARPPEFFSLELCGEAGELANFEKKSWKGIEIAQDSFADEAADVFIALMNYSNARSIDLGVAVAEKLRKIDEKRRYLK
jgi:NTP pyrophosphatase (non-canonical NTP hydrolase)